MEMDLSVWTGLLLCSQRLSHLLRDEKGKSGLGFLRRAMKPSPFI